MFGRVDFALSKDLTRDDVETNKVGDYCIDVASKLQTLGSKLDYVVGGGISSHAVPFLKQLSKYI